MGKRYEIKVIPRQEFNPKGALINGLTEAPDVKGKAIYIADELKGETLLEVTIHEALHACDWYKDEEWVCQAGHDIARLLWRLGWRKTN